MEKIRLMVVDDSREFCILVRDYLKTNSRAEFCGFALDGISALNAIQERKPDVVLLDNVMPNLDGVGVMKHIKNMTFENKPKVVAVTVCPTNSYISSMYSLDVDYIMSKNSDVKDIVDRCIMVVNNGKRNESLPDTENLITSAVCAVGIPASFKGYPFLRTSIDMVIKNPNAIHSVTKNLYPAVAEKYNTTPCRVERNIRNAIEVAWNRGNKEAFNEMFGGGLDFSKPKPTNSEFIAMFADKLRLMLKDNRKSI